MLVARDARVVAGGEPRGAERVRERRASRRSAPRRCSARRGWACGRRRTRPGSRPPPPTGSARAGRASRAGCPCRARASRAPSTAPRRAAAALVVGGGVGPQLERHGHHVVAGVERELRRGGAVHAAAHRHERPARARAAGAARRRGRRRPSARWSASAASSAACRARGQQPTELGLHVVGGRARAASRKGAPSTSSTTALPAARAAAQPRASKPASTTRSPSTRTATRTRSPQAAPPAAPACAPAGQRPAAARSVADDPRAAPGKPDTWRRRPGRVKVAPACRCHIRELGLLS